MHYCTFNEYGQDHITTGPQRVREVMHSSCAGHVTPLKTDLKKTFAFCTTSVWQGLCPQHGVVTS